MIEFGIQTREHIRLQPLDLVTGADRPGQPQGWRGDVVAVAKRDLSADEMFPTAKAATRSGQAVPAEHSLAGSALPIGLAHHVRLLHKSPAGRSCAGAMLRRRTRRLGTRAPGDGTAFCAATRAGRDGRKITGAGIWNTDGLGAPRRSRRSVSGVGRSAAPTASIDESEFQRAVAQAIDSGITCFDTAEAYGMGVSEEALSRGRSAADERTSSSRPNSASATTKCRTAATAAGRASSPRSTRACSGCGPTMSTSIS